MLFERREEGVRLSDALGAPSAASRPIAPALVRPSQPSRARRGATHNGGLANGLLDPAGSLIEGASTAAASETIEGKSLLAPALESGGRRLRASTLKRLMDIAGAFCGLVFLAPFLLLVALVILIESRGPVFFRQRRTGCGGKPFYIYKFRTMRVVEDGPTIVQATPDDSRTTRFGAFLRRSSIDELPQLLNVLKNEMSLIGPRPHAVAHDVHYAALVPDYERRFLAKPGISGLAQVSGFRGETPNTQSMAARVALDLDYIAHWSFRLDVHILIQTLLAGPFHPAAY